MFEPGYDPWREAMLDGAFECAWGICDEILRQRAGLSCAHLPHHLRWVWDGTPLAGKRVLVPCYHGLGDTLQFIRFVPRVAAVASDVAVEAQAALLPLLAASYPGIRFYPLDAAPPDWQVAVESMELPHALRLSLDELPGPVPYLQAPGRYTIACDHPAWSPPRTRGSRASPGPFGSGGRRGLDSRFRGNDGGKPVRRPRKRVGLVWAGGDWRRERSIQPHLLLPLLDSPADFVGLQLGPGRHAADAAPLLERLSEIIPEGIALGDTAALMQGLDLVVTIDTMAAHLAGALARPAWVLLDIDADWRWMRNRADSPWYPTMRLFRQPRPGAWEPVVAEAKAALEFFCASSPGTGAADALLREKRTLSRAEITDGRAQNRAQDSRAEGGRAQDGRAQIGGA